MNINLSPKEQFLTTRIIEEKIADYESRIIALKELKAIINREPEGDSCYAVRGYGSPSMN